MFNRVQTQFGPNPGGIGLPRAQTAIPGGGRQNMKQQQNFEQTPNMMTATEVPARPNFRMSSSQGIRVGGFTKAPSALVNTKDTTTAGHSQVRSQ